MARKKVQTAQKAVSAEAVKAAAPAAVKAPEVKEPEVKAPETKETEAKQPQKEAKKPAARKTAKKQEVKTSLSVQYMGKDVSEKDMIAMVKKDWTAKKNKVGDIRTMDLYVKVEENMVYYVINGTETGSVAI